MAAAATSPHSSSSRVMRAVFGTCAATAAYADFADADEWLRFEAWDGDGEFASVSRELGMESPKELHLVEVGWARTSAAPPMYTRLALKEWNSVAEEDRLDVNHVLLASEH